MARTALVTGARGQDGWYLAQLLLARGYVVHGQSRHAAAVEQHAAAVHWHIGDLTDGRFLERLIKDTAPDEIYNLAALSSPSRSWDDVSATCAVNALVPQQICELLRKLRPDCGLFQATSSEIFGDNAGKSQNEQTVCRPNSPYAIAKLYAHQTMAAYRQKYGLHVSSGVMFNHESPRRPLSFVSQKIAHAAAAVGLGMKQTCENDERGRPILLDGKVHLGNIEVRRDFGFAGDYVEAMHLMLQAQEPDDYVVGTGDSHSIAEICEVAFSTVGRHWEEHVTIDPALQRKIDTRFSRADPSKLARRLGWRPKTAFRDLISLMVRERTKFLEASASSAA